MRRLQLSCNDIFLFCALGYSIAIIVIKWDRYVSCHRPLQLYLLLDYVTIVLLRMCQLLETYFIERERTRKALTLFKLAVLYPFFIIWTIVGTLWFQDSGSCLPEKNQYWTCLIWLVMCYTWIVLYACLQVILCLRPGRHLADGTFVALQTGLTSQQIREIRAFSATQGDEEKECSICLDSYRVGVNLKELPRCQHIFHADCIDTWLTQKNTCPLCRLPILGENGTDSAVTGRRSSESVPMERVDSHEQSSAELQIYENLDIPPMESVAVNISSSSSSSNSQSSTTI